jgi:hypothetical protein
MKAFLTIMVLLLPFQVHAVEPIRIEFGQNYDGYTNDELRRRVWTLERAVAQLQAQVFQLAMNNSGPSPVNGLWTCEMQSFGKTHTATAPTRISALSKVLKKCSEATNAVHCHESDVTCDNK